MNCYETFIENLKKEVSEFKESYNNMTVTQTYNDWYIIGFYEAYYELFMSDFVDHDDYEKIYKWLSEFEYPLHFLYDQWLSADGAFNHDWDVMFDFVEDVYEEERICS